MKKSNKILIVLIFVFFLFTTYAYRGYEERKGEKYLPYKFKNTIYESPTDTPHGLVFVDGYLWISSTKEQTLIKYDLTTETVAKSFEIPCFQAAGLTFDGENFWVVDYGKRTIYEISPEGTVLGKYETPYSTPYGVAWDGEYIWVLDVYGMEEYPDPDPHGEDRISPNSTIYRYDPENDKILDIFDSPTSFAGDIAYKDDELIVTGYTSRKIYHVDIETKRSTSWYYSPDTLPRAIAVGEDNNHFVTGAQTQELWEVHLNMKAQYKDVFRKREVIVPFWLVIITLVLLFPIFLDEVAFRRKKEHS